MHALKSSWIAIGKYTMKRQMHSEMFKKGTKHLRFCKLSPNCTIWFLLYSFFYFM